MPEDKTIQELGLDEYRYGFSDPEEYFFKTPRKGIDPEIVAMISKHKNEPEWMLEFRLNALVVPGAPDPEVGWRFEPARLRRHLLLHPPDGEPGPLLGRRAGRHQEHLRQARHPAGGARVARRRGRPVRVRGRLPLLEGGVEQ